MVYRGNATGVRTCRAVALTLFLLVGWVLTGTAAGASLPPVQITYSGSMSIEVFPTEGKPSHQIRTLSWSATSSSAGSDGPLALDFSSVSGSSSLEGNNNCYDSTSTLSLAAGKNPVGEGWFLNETSDYPNKGWKYIVFGVPTEVPILESVTGRCSSVQSETLSQPNEMLLKQETFTDAQLKEYEAILEPFEFSPGKPAGRTRSFSFDGTSHCACLPKATHIKESMTLTVSATSPAGGNNVKTNPAQGGGGQSPKTAPPKQKVSEARRKQLKEQARDDLGPALEEAWKAHGLSVALGLTSGVQFSNVLDELGQQGALLASEDATARVINDYRIIKDPPDHRFHQLAKPPAARRPALRSCTGSPAPEAGLCKSLREDELAMLADSGRARAITQALLVTMNRDTTAIRAHAYAAAQLQYLHFQSLHKQLRLVLRSRGAKGAQIAALLRGRNVSGVLSSAQSAAAISAVEAKLSRARVPAAKLNAIARGALQGGETDALDSLAGPNG